MHVQSFRRALATLLGCFVGNEAMGRSGSVRVVQKRVLEKIERVSVRTKTVGEAKKRERGEACNAMVVRTARLMAARLKSARPN